jgi:hypothetical protein
MSILDRTLSYSDADRCAWNVIQLNDSKQLRFEPEEDKEILWEL